MKIVDRMIMVLFAVTMAMCFIASTSIAADSMGNDPNVKVLLENDEVRVFEAIRPPGTKVPMHEHPSFVVIFMSSYKAKQILPNGKEVEKDYTAGKASHRPKGLKHAIEILGTVDQHVIMVEMKK